MAKGEHVGQVSRQGGKQYREIHPRIEVVGWARNSSSKDGCWSHSVAEEKAAAAAAAEQVQCRRPRDAFHPADERLPTPPFRESVEDLAKVSAENALDEILGLFVG